MKWMKVTGNELPVIYSSMKIIEKDQTDNLWKILMDEIIHKYLVSMGE